ncbi:MAG: hypothetical protein B6D36_00740 [Planctomycetes bacterium UTPLA1]|jgi:hypothetical protein|nr:MAG: hypothetical protein B6D36_00740 [Planctomycetes bacterium UTPLA1]
MTPSAFRAWQRIFRDVLITVIGGFILIHETLTSDDPNPYLIAAALAAFGLPPALRLDQRRRDDEKDDG